MLLSFVVTVLFEALLLFVPGLAVCRAFKLEWTSSIAVSPVISLFLFGVAGVILGCLGIDGAWIEILCSLFFALVLSAIGTLIVRKLPVRGGGKNMPRPSKFVVGIFSLYAIVGIGFICLFYFNYIDGLDYIMQEHGDNAYHASLVKAMARSGQFSTISVSKYAGIPLNEVPVLGTSYYPAVAHIIPALACSFLGVKVGLGINAFILLTCGVILPFGLASLLFRIDANKYALIAGSVLAISCAAFPYRMLVVHQPFANTTAFCLIFGAVELFIWLCKNFSKHWVDALLLWLIALTGVALVHPNTTFVICMFCVCYLVLNSLRIYFLDTEHRREGSFKRYLVAIFAVVILSIALWFVFLNCSFMQGTVNFQWGWTIGFKEAFASLVTMGLRRNVPQFALAFLVVFGFVYCLTKKEYRWLAVALVLFGIIYISNCVGSSEVKKLFAGFWYTDSERTAALVAIASLPVASLGTGALLEQIARVIQKGRLSETGNKIASSSAVIFLALCFCFMNFKSSGVVLRTVGTGIGATKADLIHKVRSYGETVTYTPDEESFIKEVENITGDDLIINLPFDGSIYAYYDEDIELYYRYRLIPNPAGGGETEASEAIRLSLSQIASNEHVRSLVEETECKYLLRLNVDPESNDDSNTWEDSDWVGILSIDDSTPGFELVLSEGNMRLYKIVY